EPRELEIRGDVRERIQNEVTLRYPGMRQRQLGPAAPFVRVAEEIEIDHPRAPSLMLRRAPEQRLERAQLTEERRGLELGQKARDRIHEVRLGDGPERPRPVERGAQLQARPGQLRQALAGAEHLATRVVEITAYS